jgi:hypothetical protein
MMATTKKKLPIQKKIHPDASRISLDEALDWFRSQKPASGHPASCSCSWAGELGECKEKSLGANNTGWSWQCPKCGSQVMQYAFVILK